MKGRVTNITDYGAFVELEPGIEGLIHVSEMSWTKKNVHPGKIVSTSQEIEVQILEVDPVKRRISLGLKQTMRNPWEVFVEKYPPGTTVEGEVKNKTEFGLFLGLDGDIDGMVHLSDLDWKRPGEQVIEEYKKGDKVKASVLDVDVEKERISLGIKQLAGDPMSPDCRRTQEGRRRHLRGDRGQGSRPRREDRRHRPHSLHQARRNLRATARSSAPSGSRSGRKSMPASPSSTAAPTRCRCRSRRSKSPKRRKPSRSMARPNSGATLGDILGTALKRDGEKARRGIGANACRPGCNDAHPGRASCREWVSATRIVAGSGSNCFLHPCQSHK